MINIVLVKQFVTYRVLDRQALRTNLLVDFLLDDVNYSAKSFISHFESLCDHGAAMNGTQYTKTGEMVLITPEWIIDEEESIEKGCYFEIKASVLAQVLRQWDVVYAQDPLYITIMIDNDIVQIIGTNTLDE